MDYGGHSRMPFLHPVCPLTVESRPGVGFIQVEPEGYEPSVPAVGQASIGVCTLERGTTSGVPSSLQFRTHNHVRLLENSLSNTLVCGAGPSCHPKDRFDAGTKVANGGLLLRPLPAGAPYLEVANTGPTMVPAAGLCHVAGSQLNAPLPFARNGR